MDVILTFFDSLVVSPSLDLGVGTETLGSPRNKRLAGNQKNIPKVSKANNFCIVAKKIYTVMFMKIIIS